MAEIWSLDALCRCCHADGKFKNLQQQDVFDNKPENYLSMLLETLGITIKPPPVNASYSICDDCIAQLRNASSFKRKVLECEAKFEEYCKNELSILNYDVKNEPEYLDDNIFDSDTDLKDIQDVNNTQETVRVKKSRKLKDIKKEENAVRVKKSTKLKDIKKEDDGTFFEGTADVNPNIDSKPSRKGGKLHKGKSNPTKDKDFSLIVKIKTETGELFSCKNCGLSYEDLLQLNRHIATEHYRYKCLYCEESFPSELRYKKHNREIHNDTKPFHCEYCDRKLSAHLALREHINSAHTKEKYYECDVCQKTFHNKHVLRIHLKKHDGTFRKLICEQCGMGCNDKTNLRYHVLSVHEKVKLFECNDCGKKFSAAKHLKVHIRSHTGERPFECDVCLTAFASKDNLTVHKKIHNNKGYKCKTCEKVFPTRSTYASHYRTHVGAKPYKCHLCEKEFAGKYSLNRHVFEHSGERPFICQLCNKDFKQKPQLVRHHKRCHDPEKSEVIKEKCDICKRTVPNIEKHMLAHSNKPYGCHLCEKRYPLQNALNRHLQRHAGIKPHRCDLCEKGFIQQKSLKNHKLKVHKIPLKTEQEDHYDSLVTRYTIQNLKRK